MTKEEWKIWFVKTSYHRVELEANGKCVCYYCLESSNVSEIREWCDAKDGKGQTAICPKCGIDGVVAFDHKNPKEQLKLLKAAHKIGFGYEKN